MNESKEEEVGLPSPDKASLKFIQEKNKEMEILNKESSPNININYRKSASNKQCVEILRQRLDIADRTKSKAIADGKELKEKIKKQEDKLRELKKLKSELHRIKSNYDKIVKENTELRQEIKETIETNSELKYRF